MTDKEKWVKEYKYNRNFAWFWSILFVVYVALSFSSEDKISWFITFTVTLDLIFNYIDKAMFFKSMSK